MLVDSFVRLTENLKLYNYIKLIEQLYEKYSVTKLVKEQKKSQLKYYQMVLYTIKNLLPIKDILKTLPSIGINNYIKILQRQCSRKTAVKKLGKME